MKIKANAVLGTITVLLGVAVIATGWELGFSLSAEGAGLFPVLVGAGLVLCGLCQVVTASVTDPEGYGLSAINWPMVAKTLGALAAYVLLVNFLGYLATTFLFVLVQAYMLGARGWLKLGAIALGTAVAFAFVFQSWMQMPLPEGVLGVWRF